MKRALALILIVLLGVMTIPARATSVSMDSVQPLQVVQVLMDGESGGVQAGLRNICTTTSINERLHYWLTAAHCVVGEDATYYIQGDEARVVMRDVLKDIAVVQTLMAVAVAIPLATVAPTFGDPVRVIGYPLGYRQPMLSFGSVMNPSMAIAGKERDSPEYQWSRAFMMLQLVGAPGNSGSAVLNAEGAIVSIIQIGSGQAFAPVMGGATFAALEGFRSYWVE